MKKKDLLNLLNHGATLIMQGGSKLHQHGGQPTVSLPKSKRFNSITRTVTGVYTSDEKGVMVRDHVGEMWRAKRMADGNYRAFWG